jgi:hypothetical protein
MEDDVEEIQDVQRPKRLEFRNFISAGLQIHAHVQFKANCGEFIMKEGAPADTYRL